MTTGKSDLNGLFYSLMCVCLVTSNSLQPHGLCPTRLLCPWDSPGKITAVGCHFLLQGIFPTQGSNPCLLHLLCWQAHSVPLWYLGSPFYSLISYLFCKVIKWTLKLLNSTKKHIERILLSFLHFSFSVPQCCSQRPAPLWPFSAFSDSVRKGVHVCVILPNTSGHRPLGCHLSTFFMPKEVKYHFTFFHLFTSFFLVCKEDS